MLLQLMKALETNDLTKVVQHLSMAPIDIDLMFYQAQHDGEVEIDKAKNRITALKEPAEPWFNPELAQKIAQMVREYDRQEANITRNRLEQDVLDLAGRYGYPIHEFICTMYALEQGVVPGAEELQRYEISVPAIKNKRPYNNFVFYTFCDHQEYGAKAVNNFIAQFESKKVK